MFGSGEGSSRRNVGKIQRYSSESEDTEQGPHGTACWTGISKAWNDWVCENQWNYLSN